MGNFEWNGRWGDNSEEWTDKLRKQLNQSSDPLDGIFWMSLNDF